MKRLILLFFVITYITVLNSCIKDYKSSTATYLINESTVPITIIPYQDGYAIEEEKKIISSGERIQVFKDSPWGKTLRPNWGTIINFYDSVIVIFKDSFQYPVRHLVYNDTISCHKCVPYGDPRNLAQEENYKKVIEKEHRNYMRGYYEYTFTEEDYNFAKE